MNQVNKEYQEMLSERIEKSRQLTTGMTTHQHTMQTLLTSGPYARTVARQVDEYFANVAEEDREPPCEVSLFDDVPDPINPYCGEKV
jgi:hypothetical protein